MASVLSLVLGGSILKSALFFFVWSPKMKTWPKMECCLPKHNKPRFGKRACPSLLWLCEPFVNHYCFAWWWHWGWLILWDALCSSFHLWGDNKHTGDGPSEPSCRTLQISRIWVAKIKCLGGVSWSSKWHNVSTISSVCQRLFAAPKSDSSTVVEGPLLGTYAVYSNEILSFSLLAQNPNNLSQSN